MGLNGKTPAEMANIELDLKENKMAEADTKEPFKLTVRKTILLFRSLEIRYKVE